jgi:hypothetical protein
MTVATALAVSWNPLTNSKLSASANARHKSTAVGTSMPRLVSTDYLWSQS